MTPARVIRTFRRGVATGTLGPGRRAVLWVQGCSLGCAECIVPESWRPGAGDESTVVALDSWVRGTLAEGLTLSGGEPFQQAAALASLLAAVGPLPLGVLCYTGHTHEALRSSTDPGHAALLARVDLLVDGPYVAERHAPLRWRGSSNQRLVPLTPLGASWTEGADTPAGMEVTLDEGGAPELTGVPPVRGFRAAWERRLAARGVEIVARRSA